MLKSFFFLNLKFVTVALMDQIDVGFSFFKKLVFGKSGTFFVSDLGSKLSISRSSFY